MPAIAAPVPTTAPAPATAPRLPLATVDDLDCCTCNVPLNGTVPHRPWCDLRHGTDR